MLWSGKWARVSQVQGGLERSRESFEGAPPPRARWTITRGGVGPSSEAETQPRGRLPQERGGDFPKGVTTPRATRRFARGGNCPSSKVQILWCGAWPLSKTEVCLRGAEAGCLMGC
jgi:hypothetical protein